MDILTPAEYMPYLVIIGLVGVAITLVRCYGSLDEHNKQRLRDGTISERATMGLDYLAANIAVCIVSVVGAYLVPGYVYDAIHAAPVLSGCAIVALIWAMLCGTLGNKFANELIDKRRNGEKIDLLEMAAKDRAKAETQQADDGSTVQVKLE